MPKHVNTIWIFIKVLANLLLLRPFGFINIFMTDIGIEPGTNV